MPIERGVSSKKWLCCRPCRLAGGEGESEVDQALRFLLDAGRTADGVAVAAALRQGRRPPAVTDVLIMDVDLTMYDRLLEPREDHEYSIGRHEDTIDRQFEGT